MPRQAGLDTLGAIRHIRVRGINRSQIFDDDEDRSRFLTRLSENILETHSFLYAWVLMETHVHPQRSLKLTPMLNRIDPP